MNDRELLELAAKAAGIAVPKQSPWGGFDDRLGFYELASDGSHVTSKWNPLEDDGDALRLAVKLQLTICNEHINAGVAYCTNGDTDYPSVASGENEKQVIDSDFTATRRAIVLAAAEIGRDK